MKNKCIQIGLIGCSYIAPLSLINPAKEVEGFCVYGAASRDWDRTQEYTKRYGIPKSFKSYDELLEDEEIDLVYISLANHLHCEWAIKAAEKGKHILVEKPICLNFEEFNRIKDACERRGVYVLEALMVQQHTWQDYLKTLIDEERYGKLLSIKTEISSIFGDEWKDNFRFFLKYGGGVFKDEAPYWLQFIQKMIGLDPVTFRGRSLFNGPNNCDWTYNAELMYSSGIHVLFDCSFEKPRASNHYLEFENAGITIRNFFRPAFGNNKFYLDVSHNGTGYRERIEFNAQNYYVNQLKFISDVLHNKVKNIPIDESGERVRLAEKIYQTSKP